MRVGIRLGMPATRSSGFWTRFLWVVAAAAALAPRSLLAQHGPDNWNRFRFVGNVTFSDTQLRAALVAEPDFLLANHPHSDHADVRAVTHRLLLAGYQNAGFHQPRIDIDSQPAGDTTITIDEGPRFYRGEVRVVGAKRIDASALIQLLTTPQPAPSAFPVVVQTASGIVTQWRNAAGVPLALESPRWSIDQPAPAIVNRTLRHAIQKAFTALGYPHATHRAIIQLAADRPATENPATQSRRVELLIEIADEGVKDTIESFEVTGCTVNTTDQILAFLGVQPGCEFDAGLQRLMNQKLFDSGRFHQHTLTFQRNGPAGGRLLIELEEVQGAPPLSQPHSDVAEILLRSQQWFSDWQQRGEDLVLECGDAQAKLRLVVSPEGTILQLESLDEESTAPPPAEIGVTGTTILLDANELAISWGNAETFWLANVASFNGTIRPILSLQAAREEDHFAFTTFNVTGSTGRVADEPLLMQTLGLTPAGWCAFAYKPQVNCQQQDGKLILTQNDVRWEIEIASGRLLELQTETVSVSMQSGVFVRLREELRKQRAHRTNVYLAAQPVSSLIGFLTSSATTGGLNDLAAVFRDYPALTDRSLRSAIARLTAAGLFAPLDVFVDHASHWGLRQRFEIPTDHPDVPNWTQQLAIAASGFILKFLPDVFAEETWPIKVCREACLVVLGKDRHTHAVLTELHLDHSPSPLRDASVAYLLALAGHPHAKPMADRALRTLDADTFNHDLQTVLSGRLGRWLTGVQAGFATLEPDEADALAGLVTSDWAKSIFQNVPTLDPIGNRWFTTTGPLLQAKLQEIMVR